MARLDEVKSAGEMIAILSGGYPGAVHAMIEYVEAAKAIDPFMAQAGSMFVITTIDSFGIYDADFHTLYKVVCQEDLVAMHACTRSIQLGLVPREDVFSAITGEKSLDLKDVIAKVKNRLPGFAKGIPSVFDETPEYLQSKPQGLSGGPG